MEEALNKHFRKSFTAIERQKSFDFIETFIGNHVQDWTNTPDTDSISNQFLEYIHQLSLSDFAFLLSHAGYIPEFYEHALKIPRYFIAFFIITVFTRDFHHCSIGKHL